MVISIILRKLKTQSATIATVDQTMIEASIGYGRP